MKSKPLLLAVDDDPINLDILEEFLSDSYQLILANDGEEALRILHAQAENIEAVLLDCMMPGIDGIEVLRQIQRDDRLKLIPVVMQTAADDAKQVSEGIKSGCFYYLTKPFDRNVLQEIVSNAVRNRNDLKVLHTSLVDMKSALAQLETAEFKFKTRRDAQQIIAMLANLSHSPDLLGMGLMELALNAVEHGNLGLSYDEKTLLLEEDRLEQEIERRLSLPEYRTKQATLRFRRLDRALEFTISDEGNGFDWTDYLEMHPERMMDNHGRGIAMARGLTFASVNYLGNGNTVVAIYTLTDAP